MSDPDFQAVGEALFAVESRHHIHGHECLCGFASAKSRDRTAHIARETLAELLGREFIDKVSKSLDGEASG